MTIIQKLQARKAITRVAKRQGISLTECRAEMAAAITEAWTTADPETRKRQVQLVGEGRVPTPEEFVVLVAGRL
jgi:hypothetical protein